MFQASQARRSVSERATGLFIRALSGFPPQWHALKPLDTILWESREVGLAQDSALANAAI